MTTIGSSAAIGNAAAVGRMAVLGKMAGLGNRKISKAALLSMAVCEIGRQTALGSAADWQVDSVCNHNSKTAWHHDSLAA